MEEVVSLVAIEESEFDAELSVDSGDDPQPTSNPNITVKNKRILLIF
jgi:hypothetical protein